MNIILHTLFSYWLAENQAKHDFELISNHKYVNHIKGWLIRAFGSLAYLAILKYWTGMGWWEFMALASMGAAVFSAFFKHKLNTLRGLDPHYISTSNHYDSFFIKHFIKPGKAQFTFEIIVAVVMAIISLM